MMSFISQSRIGLLDRWFIWEMSHNHKWSLVLVHPDTDECLSNNGGCSHNCWNTEGSFHCSCPSGYTMSSDNKTCTSMWEILNNLEWWFDLKFYDTDEQSHWFMQWIWWLKISCSGLVLSICWYYHTLIMTEYHPIHDHFFVYW